MMPVKVKNVVTVLYNRERGCRTNCCSNVHLQRIAEEKAACSEMQETHCKLPTSVRSTFLMSFSPDSTKVASTHGDHKIYVCDVKTGKLLHKLEGHPRTPWCLAFHPTSNDILASGCLGGEVRVWHLHGGSEKWGAEHNTVITSLTFHPLDRVLVIATCNQIYFWDWSLPEPFASCRTGSEREKVRFVKFDMLGNRLITGISNQPEVVRPSSGAATCSSESHSASRHLGRSYDPLTSYPSTPASVPHRRSLWTRVMNMYQHSEGIEENGTERPTSPTQEDALSQARHYAESLTQASRLHRQEQELHERLNSEPSTSGYRPPNQNVASSSSESRELSSDTHDEYLMRAFWRTFHRLRFYCSSLERRVHQLQRNTESQTATGYQSNGGISPPTVQPQPPAPSDSASEPTQSTNSTSSSIRPNYRQVTAGCLISILTRLQNSLQFSAISSTVAQEQIQQLQWRISEILERLTNVTGYRARLTTLREQIYEVAERSERRGDETSPIRSLDLAHCLWLVEMSLQLTQQMQRILHADYRLTQLHINSSSQPSTSGTSSSSSESAGNRHHLLSATSRNCAICGNQGPVDTSSSEEFDLAWDRLRVVVRRELEALTERFRTNLFNELHPSANTEGRAFRIRSSESTEGQSSSVWQQIHFLRPLMDHSSDRVPRAGHYRAPHERAMSDNSDEDDTLPNRLRRDDNLLFGGLFSAWESYRARISGRQSQLNSNRGAGLQSMPSFSSAGSSQQSNFHIPEVNIVPSSSSANDAEPLPLHERPRSPPLSAILSGSSDPFPSSWFRAMYDAAIHPQFGNCLHEVANSYFHRVQSWDFSKFEVPEISNAKTNVVVPKCKIHNDASIDISKDGELLVALVPSSGISVDSVMFAVYSLVPKNLGHCLYTWAFDSNAISVSFSPLGQYIVVGLATPRLYLSSAEKEAVAQIFKLKYIGSCCIATHVRSLTQQNSGGNHHPGVSLNSVQWLPQPGQGLIYGTNRGCLCICKPLAPMSGKTSRNIKVQRSYDRNLSLGIRNRTFSSFSLQRMFSTSTQTVEPETQTTGTQTFGPDANTSSSR